MRRLFLLSVIISISYCWPVHGSTEGEPEDQETIKSFQAIPAELTSLVSSQGRFTRIPASIGRLVNLTQLQLTRNNIRNISPEIGKLSLLKVLILDDNKIEALPDSLWGLTKVEHLSLSGNKLQVLSPKISGLTALVFLNISFNEIKELPGTLSQLKSLQSIWAFDMADLIVPAKIFQAQSLRKIMRSSDEGKIIQMIAVK